MAAVRLERRAARRRGRSAATQAVRIPSRADRVLRRRLSFVPADIVSADLTADGFLGKGPGQRSGTVAIDKFIAAQDGTKTFTIPGRDPHDDRCLFSGVLLEGLWGTKPGAFSKLLPGKVTSRSLGAYLETEVPPIAERYEVTLQPSVSPTFPEDDDVLRRWAGDDATRIPAVADGRRDEAVPARQHRRAARNR